MEQLSNLLEKRIKNLSLTKSVTASQICVAFLAAAREVNPKLAEKAEPLFYRDQVLTILVPSSAFANELLMYQHLIVKKINLKFRKLILKRLRYRLRD